MAVASASRLSVRKVGSIRAERRREASQGFLCISPWLLGFLAFTLIPMAASFYLSFTRYRIVRPPDFTGLANYRYALFEDYLFWHSLGRTGLWALYTVPLGIVGSLVAAILLNQGLHGTTFYRTCFFLPSLTPVVAAALLWKWMFNPDVGVINWALSTIGIRGPGWLETTTWAMPALVIVSLWTGIGSGRMLIFLAALQGVPQELYEASEIDGASALRKHLHITVPLITPAIFFNLIMGLLGSFQSFTLAFLTTEGGPANALYFFALHIYYQAFMHFEMGYACALSWFMFALVLIITAIQFAGSNRWVYYESKR
jgi:multiple sugar transport system permease protein